MIDDAMIGGCHIFNLLLRKGFNFSRTLIFLDFSIWEPFIAIRLLHIQKFLFRIASYHVPKVNIVCIYGCQILTIRSHLGIQ